MVRHSTSRTMKSNSNWSRTNPYCLSLQRMQPACSPKNISKLTQDQGSSIQCKIKITRLSSRTQAVPSSYNISPPNNKFKWNQIIKRNRIVRLSWMKRLFLTIGQRGSHKFRNLLTPMAVPFLFHPLKISWHQLTLRKLTDEEKDHLDRKCQILLIIPISRCMLQVPVVWVPDLTFFSP